MAERGRMARGMVRAGVGHLFTEGGDPRVPGEGEEEEGRTLEHAPGRPRRTRSGAHGSLSCPRRRLATTTAARTTRTNATTTRVASALRWTPVTLRAVTASTAAAATRCGCCGTAYAPTVSAIAAQLAVLPDDETPAGEVSPERAQSFTAVDVGAARLRVHRGEAGRRGRVGVGDEGRTRVRGGALPCRRGGRGERREDTRHRAWSRGRGRRRREGRDGGPGPVCSPGHASGGDGV